jgi:hypothetical protein
MDWKKDRECWMATDTIGYRFSCRRIFTHGKETWAIAWSERDGIRIGSNSYASEDEAKNACNELASA